MMPQQRLIEARNTLSELAQAHMKAALCVGQLQDLFATNLPVVSPKVNLPIADDQRFCVIWRNHTCFLGHTRSYSLFEKLLRRCNHYVSYDQLLRDVWHGDARSQDTVRSAIRELKEKLSAAKMQKLSRAICGQGRHYGLILDHV